MCSTVFVSAQSLAMNADESSGTKQRARLHLRCRADWLALALLCLNAAGCGSSAETAGSADAADYSKVRNMSEFYDAYLKAHRGQAPRDEQAFRAFLEGKQEQLQKAGLTIDQMFASPRDGRPLKWVYARKPPHWNEAGITCYAYEAEPTNGRRLVVGSRGMFDEMDETQFRRVFPKG